MKVKEGVLLAFSWLTVLPVRGPEQVDRGVAGGAIGWAPVVGGVLGAGAAAMLWGVGAAGGPWLLGGLLAVGFLALITRGMHIDGLADTLDGLGSYGPPERAREIMKSGGAGPFGVAGLVFAIGIQAVSFAGLAADGRWGAVVLAVCVGRIAVVAACRRGIEAAPGAGFGALVAGTRSWASGLVWGGIAMIAGVFAGGEQWWLGPVVVLAALAVPELVVRHCVRRFGGLNGDVLGAAVEIAVTLTAAGLTLHP